VLHNRDRLHFHILDPDIGASLDGKNDLVDPGLFTLDFHGYRAIPFVPYPSGASIKFCCMASPIPEADSLHIAVKYNVLSHYIVIFHPFRQPLFLLIMIL
jgi:hypothetical protein